MSKDKFDFERVMLLFNVAEKARAHGSAYTNIVAAADAELRAINSGGPDVPKPRVITPAAGPASSQVQNPDGSLKAINDPQLSPADRPKNLSPGYDPNDDLRGIQQPMPDTEARETPPDPLRKI